MSSIRVDQEWEIARLQIAGLLEGLIDYFDIASTLNAREIQQVSTLATTEVPIAHNYNGIPTGYIVTGQSAPGTLYYSKASDSTNMYFKSDAASGTVFDIMIF